MDDYTLDDHGARPGAQGFEGNTRQQLPVVNWLADLPETRLDTDLVEVQFKNTRKAYFVNSYHFNLEKGEPVVVEANPGHDIGTVTLTGRLVLSQIRKNKINLDRYEMRRIYRRVKPVDWEKYNEAKAKEQPTMIRARQIAQSLGLAMKIGDVEFQGDGSKAIFYYIADERVDFRQLIKVFADEFKVRIEMKQIGARQEAGRIGGIGPCGRELCCTTWMCNFSSVSTTAARAQDLSTNPLKLAGQCAKIKCCVNFEADIYAEALREFPRKDVVLETEDGQWYQCKADTFKRTISYSSDPKIMANVQTISIARAKEVIEMNRQGQKPATLGEIQTTAPAEKQHDYENVVGQDSLTRFDRKGGKNGNRNKRKDKSSRDKAQADGAQRTDRQPRDNNGGNSGGNSANQERRERNNNQDRPRRDRQERQDRQPRDNNGGNNNGANTANQERRERNSNQDRPRRDRQEHPDRQPRDNNGNNNGSNSANPERRERNNNQERPRRDRQERSDRQPRDNNGGNSGNQERRDRQPRPDNSAAAEGQKQE